MSIAQASFPKRQAIATPTTLKIAVRNTGEKTVPNLALTVDSLTYHAQKPPGLADNERPTWIVNTGPGDVAKPPVETAEVSLPGGAQTAYVHTWALGKLPPKATKVFRWKLTPVRAGQHTVHFRVAAGLSGKAKATLASGKPPIGQLTVNVAPQPPHTHVNPNTGKPVPGAYSVSAGPVGAVP